MNENAYRAASGTTFQTTIATSFRAGVRAGISTEVAVSATLETKRELDGITTIYEHTQILPEVQSLGTLKMSAM